MHKHLKPARPPAHWQQPPTICVNKAINSINSDYLSRKIQHSYCSPKFEIDSPLLTGRSLDTQFRKKNSHSGSCFERHHRPPPDTEVRCNLLTTAHKRTLNGAAEAISQAIFHGFLCFGCEWPCGHRPVIGSTLPFGRKFKSPPSHEWKK